MAVLKPPVIAIDGPAASGKGTVARLLAKRLNFHYLESGKIYRSIGLLAIKRAVQMEDESALIALAEEFVFEGGLRDDAELESEQVGAAASRLAVIPALRTCLLSFQRAQLIPPGLVAEGRDMAGVVFPEAVLKVYLTADLLVRAARRREQLRVQGLNDRIKDICTILERRDKRDAERAVAPLGFAIGYWRVDSTKYSAQEVVQQLAEVFERRQQGEKIKNDWKR